MNELRFTLLSDGSSDEALLPILTWLLRENGVQSAIQSAWADLRRLRRPPQKLSERIKRSVDLYPCDLLFIHRDAENVPYDIRLAEIREAIQEVHASLAVLPMVCVIPVRMQEAWLLFDEQAIRQASGNQYGRQPLQLPPIFKLEQVPDPKAILYETLRAASGLKGRRRKRILVAQCARRVAEFIDDFSPLRSLSAFHALENEIQRVIKAQVWQSDIDSETPLTT